VHINDNIFASLFFTLTGLHFFHLVVGLTLLSLVFYAHTFPYRQLKVGMQRITEINLFYSLQIFYWHFVEILWLFIYITLYMYYTADTVVGMEMSVTLGHKAW